MNAQESFVLQRLQLEMKSQYPAVCYQESLAPNYRRLTDEEKEPFIRCAREQLQELILNEMDPETVLCKLVEMACVMKPRQS